MRKMSASILALNRKAIEISAERFKHMKCDKNIFVWKCHNQHSWTLRVAWRKKRRSCQKYSTPASVIFIKCGLDRFFYLRSLNAKCVFCESVESVCTAVVLGGVLSFIYETNWLDSNHNENVLSFRSLGKFGLFPTSFWPSYGTKDQAMFEKRQWWKLVHLGVDSLFCSEHNNKQPTFGKSLGYLAAKFMHFDNGTQTFSSQIRIKVTYVFKGFFYFLNQTKNSSVEHEPEMSRG